MDPRLVSRRGSECVSSCQVLPAFAERYAITLWYYDGTPEQATAAIQRHLGGDMGSGVEAGKREREMIFYQAAEAAGSALKAGDSSFCGTILGDFLTQEEHTALHKACEYCGETMPVWLKGKEAGWSAVSPLRRAVETTMEALAGVLLEAAPAASQRHRSRTKVIPVATKMEGVDAEMVRFCDNPDRNGRSLSLIYCIGAVTITLLLHRGGETGDLTRVDLKPNQSYLLWAECVVRVVKLPEDSPRGWLCFTFYSDRNEALSAYQRCTVHPEDANSNQKKITWLNAYLESGRSLLGLERGVKSRAAAPDAAVTWEECHGISGFDTAIGEASLRLFLLLDSMDSSLGLELEIEDSTLCVEAGMGTVQLVARILLPLDEGSVSAKFDKASHVLTITAGIPP